MSPGTPFTKVTYRPRPVSHFSKSQLTRHIISSIYTRNRVRLFPPSRWRETKRWRSDIGVVGPVGTTRLRKLRHFRKGRLTQTIQPFYHSRVPQSFMFLNKWTWPTVTTPFPVPTPSTQKCEHPRTRISRTSYTQSLSPLSVGTQPRPRPQDQRISIILKWNLEKNKNY